MVTTLSRVIQIQLYLFFSLVTFFFSSTLSADSTTPTISIVIDDLGYRIKDDMRALNLPTEVAYAILPHGPHTERISVLAHQKGHELILHQPMQAMEDNKYLGPGGLTLNMTRDEFIKTLNINIDKVPNIIGVNNHMGSLLTRHPGHMQWLMETLKNRGFLFIDSITSNESVAADVAKENNLPYLSRDVFLDHEQQYSYIKNQFMELIKTAKRKGSALGIGHPHPNTVSVLSKMLIDVEKHGVKLISVSELLSKKYKRQNYAQRTDTTRAGM